MKIPQKAPSSLVPARNWHMQYVAEHMRPDEREHWCAMTGATTYDIDTAARALMMAPGLKLAIVDGAGIPAVVGGFTQIRSKVLEAWMAGTPHGWNAQWRDITRSVRWMFAQQFEAGAQRIQIVTLESRQKACQWYADGLGMQLESVMRQAGAHGENLVTYVSLAGEAS